MASDPSHTGQEVVKHDKRVHFRDVLGHFFSQRRIRSSDSESSLVDVPLKKTVGKLCRTRSHEELDSSGNNINNSNDNNAVVQPRSQSSSKVNSYVGRLLTISPANQLIFKKQVIADVANPTFQYVDTIKFNNTLQKNVAFKIKTTAPSKFKARPSSGIVAANSTKEATVYLLADPEEIYYEKFLIMATEVENNLVDLKQLFKNTPWADLMHHKLSCSVAKDDDNHKESRSTLGIKSYAIEDIASQEEQEDDQSTEMYSLSPTGSNLTASTSPRPPLGKPSQTATEKLPSKRNLEDTPQKDITDQGIKSVETTKGINAENGVCNKDVKNGELTETTHAHKEHSHGKSKGDVRKRQSRDDETPEKRISVGMAQFETGFLDTFELSSYFSSDASRKCSKESEPVVRRPKQFNRDSRYQNSQTNVSHVFDEDVHSEEPTIDDIDFQVEQLELQTLRMHRQLNLLLLIQFLTVLILALIMFSYSCFGEDLFTKYLALPFDFCHAPNGRKC